MEEIEGNSVHRQSQQSVYVETGEHGGDEIKKKWKHTENHPAIKCMNLGPRTNLKIQGCERQPILVLSVDIADGGVGLLQLCLA